MLSETSTIYTYVMDKIFIDGLDNFSLTLSNFDLAVNRQSPHKIIPG